MLLKDFIKDSRSALEAFYPASEAASIVEILCTDVIGVSRVQHIMEPSYEVPSRFGETLRLYMERLCAGEPLQYVLGFAEFYGRRFAVSPAVLIPRPETELLVQEVVRCSRGAKRILDLCTGSGCIAWSLAAEILGSSVDAVDISDDALAVASAQKIDIPNPPHFEKADVLAEEIAGEYDIIVSNPPYVRESERAAMRANVLEHEPELALFVPDEDPLIFYRAVARIASRCLQRPGSFGVVEINEAFAPETEAVFRDEGFRNIRTIVDFCGKNRHIYFEK